MDLVAYVCRVAESDFRTRVVRLAASFNAPEIGFHSLSLRNWNRDFPRILSLYNDAWSDNAWATPVGREEARLIARLMLPVCRPSWVRIATFKGEDIAIIAQIPDVNEALRGLDGKLLPFGFARLLWRVHVRGTRMARVPMIGVAKKWRHTKVAVLAYNELLARSIEDARNAGV